MFTVDDNDDTLARLDKLGAELDPYGLRTPGRLSSAFRLENPTLWHLRQSKAHLTTLILRSETGESSISG